MAKRPSWGAAVPAVCALLGAYRIGWSPGPTARPQEMGPAAVAAPEAMAGGTAIGGGPRGARIQSTGPSPAPTNADGVVYVAFEGTLSAFDAKALSKLGETRHHAHPGLI